MKSVVVITSVLLTATVNAQPPRDAALDRKVISKLSTQFRIHSEVIQHLDLTEPFLLAYDRSADRFRVVF